MYYKAVAIQSSVCNGCDDVLMVTVDINSIAILNIHGVDYCYIVNKISKSEAINSFLKYWCQLKKWIIIKDKLCYIITECDVSKGVDVDKTSASKECIICHYCFF